MDAVWGGRSDGHRDETGSWVWGSVNGDLGFPIVTNGDFAAYLCESA